MISARDPLQGRALGVPPGHGEVLIIIIVVCQGRPVYPNVVSLLVTFSPFRFRMLNAKKALVFTHITMLMSFTKMVNSNTLSNTVKFLLVFHQGIELIGSFSQSCMT